jgi:hypothetical protein
MAARRAGLAAPTELAIRSDKSRSVVLSKQGDAIAAYERDRERSGPVTIALG